MARAKAAATSIYGQDGGRVQWARTDPLIRAEAGAPMRDGADVLVGIDSGTSVVKAVAFDLAGRQLASAAVLNRYATGADGSACQPLGRTWTDCVQALRGLGDKVEGLARRTAAIAVTAAVAQAACGGSPVAIWALLDLVTIVVLGSGLYLWVARLRKVPARSTGTVAEQLAEPSR